MQEHNRKMYELEFPAPEVRTSGSDGPTLIVALQGYADAGHAVEASYEHLLAALDHRLVASFHTDELIDYRSRRPTVTIDHNTVVDMEDPSIGINVLRDSHGKSFLLLSGPEPDLRWDAFSKSVVSLVERFGVTQTICLYAAPMAVPHTRPLMVSAHGNKPELLEQQFSLDSKIAVPGAAALQLERRLHQQGHSVAGYTAHVPHYLAASSYPQATLGLLEAVSNGANLQLPLRTLEEDAAKVSAAIEEQVAGTAEIEQVVHMLEQQYDEELERYKANNPDMLLPGEQSVPSGEQLGAEFERFLANLDSRSITDGQVPTDTQSSSVEEEDDEHKDSEDNS